VLTRFFTKEWRLAWVVIIGLVSLVAAEYYMPRDASAVFFLAPFRVVEFAVGAFLALSGARAPGPAWAHGFSIAGLGAIIASVAMFAEGMRFPGISALLPCVGTGLLILSGPQAIVNRVIAEHPFRYIGQISYSLYLIHWPIVVYYAYLYGEPKEFHIALMLTAVSIAVGSAMYHFVETPFRRKRDKEFVIPHRMIGYGALAASALSALVYVLPVTGALKQGIPPELKEIYAQLENGRERNDKMVRFATCHASGRTEAQYMATWPGCMTKNNSPRIAILGDSHGADLWGGVNLNFPKVKPLQFTGGGCSWVTRARVAGSCKYLRAHQFKWIKANRSRVSTAIYTQRGLNLMIARADGTGRMIPNPKSLTLLRKRLEHFAKTTGVPVVFWGPRPEFHPGVETLVARSRTLSDIKRILPTLNWRDYVALNKALELEFAKSSVKYIPVVPSLCSDTACNLIVDDKYVGTWDFAHWTPEGAQAWVGKVVKERGLEGLITSQSTAASLATP
jgi:SGNH domain (fused to AT3 domains)/Acyltransferase family